jgi:hypothetical protein
MTDPKKTWKLIFKAIKLEKNQKIFLKIKMTEDGNIDMFVTKKELDELEGYANKYKLFHLNRLCFHDREAGHDRKIK